MGWSATIHRDLRRRHRGTLREQARDTELAVARERAERALYETWARETGGLPPCADALWRIGGPRES